MTTALEGVKGSASLPGLSLPPGKTRYPLYGRMGGPQGRSGKVRKISPHPRFDPRIVQSVASRYTDYATRPTNRLVGLLNLLTGGENCVQAVDQHTWKPQCSVSPEGLRLRLLSFPERSICEVSADWTKFSASRFVAE
jgi:hypothetical protein